MKIVIGDGKHSADYIIGMYKNRKNNVIVINSNEQTAQYLSENNDIPVIYGKMTREKDLATASVEGADLFIALSESDIENYVACRTAKLEFNVKRCIATVQNPKNVDIFKKLGIDSVLSSTYLLAEQIKNEASIESLLNTITLEDNKIIIIEIQIMDDYQVNGKTLGQINISSLASVSAVYRDGNVIIPNGSTKLKSADKVLLVTTSDKKEKVISVFQRKA